MATTTKSKRQDDTEESTIIKVVINKGNKAKVRISYPRVFDGQQSAYQDGGAKSFTCTMLVPKKSQAAKQLGLAIEQAAIQSWGDNTALWPKDRWNPLRDGDEEYPDVPDYEGMYFVKAQRKEEKGAPQVIGVDGEDMLSKKDLQAGDYCAFSLLAYAYGPAKPRKNEKTGTGFYLNAVLKLEDGEPLSGTTNAKADFYESDDEEVDESDDDSEGGGF